MICETMEIFRTIECFCRVVILLGAGKHMLIFLRLIMRDTPIFVPTPFGFAEKLFAVNSKHLQTS